MSNSTASNALAPTASSLPEPIQRRGLDEFQWRTLTNNLFPGARSESVLMVVDYCRARKLDPLKKPCHIVPMEVKDAKTGTKSWRDVVMPGIYEYRTTAQRTGEYMGKTLAEYGPVAECFGVTAPEWCSLTVFRWNSRANEKVPFPVKVFFREVVALSKDYQSQELRANSRWSKAPIQMLTKCTEAAALREAFPDELGGEQTAEEMDGQRVIDVTPDAAPRKVLPKPEGYDEWLATVRPAADAGIESFETFWAGAPQACRDYLTATELDLLDDLKAHAESQGDQA